jgi:hypothetical protein
MSERAAAAAGTPAMALRDVVVAFRMEGGGV